MPFCETGTTEAQREFFFSYDCLSITKLCLLYHSILIQFYLKMHCKVQKHACELNIFTEECRTQIWPVRMQCVGDSYLGQVLLCDS